MVGYAMPRRKRDAPYEAAVGRWHDAIAARFAALLADELDETSCGAFLVWGDPSLLRQHAPHPRARLEASGRFALDF